MSEVITGVVKLTFGFLANKIRDGIAERLKDGDVTDEECRRLIIRELDDIKKKLNGLARSVLLSSLCFLQEGVNRLYQSLLQVDSNENTAESPDQATSLETASFGDTASHGSFMNEPITLINAMTSLKIRSNDRFKSAIESFKLAREEATKAFCNEALSIEDRIQASQIRMMARILENLEDPEASASDCLQYLKQLHDIGAIREIFSALINGGMKSRFNKTKRLNNATSVQVMNQVLSEFIEKFTKSSLLARIFAWPTISLGKETYHPLCGEDRLSEKLESSGVQVMSLDSNFTFDDRIHSKKLSVVNSKGDIVALARDGHTFKVFKRSGESRILCEAPSEESPALECRLEAMDIDGKDNLYVIAKIWSTPNSITGEYYKTCNFMLFIFDENGNKRVVSLLPLDVTMFEDVCRMAIHKDGFKIAVVLNNRRLDSILYICHVITELNLVIFDKRVSLVDFSYVHTVRFSSFEEIIVAATLKTVYIYTENGESQRKIEERIEHKGTILSVAINHATKRILFSTKRPSGISLLSFTETGELQDSLYFGFRDRILHARLISHPNGPVALVHETGATLLQL